MLCCNYQNIALGILYTVLEIMEGYNSFRKSVGEIHQDVAWNGGL